MSKSAGCLAIAAIMLLVPAARAQSRDEVERRRRSVAIASEAYLAAGAAHRAEDQRRLQLPVVRRYAGLSVRADTSRVPASFLEQLDTAFAHARADAFALFGVATDSLLAGTVVVLRTHTVERQARERGPLTREWVMADPVWPRNSPWTLGFPPLDRRWPLDEHRADDMTRYFEQWFIIGAGLRMPPRIRGWMGSQPHFRDWGTTALEIEHFGLVFHPSSIGLACTQGSLGACRASLALAADGDTIGLWFDETTRRARAIGALRVVPGLNDGHLGVGRATASRCVEHGDDAACRAVLARARVPSPTTRSSREYILRSALLRGGERAFERLRADTAASIEAAIAQAATVPFDSLIGPWREAVLAARPPSPAPNVRELLLGVVLIAGTLGVAVARSPR